MFEQYTNNPVFSRSPVWERVSTPDSTGGLLLTAGGMGPAASQERDQRSQVGGRRRKTKGQPKAQVQRQGLEAHK